MGKNTLRELSMKLSVISEVANPKLSNMDGVNVSEKGTGNILYEFIDPDFPDTLYSVSFMKSHNFLDYRLGSDPAYIHLKMYNKDRVSYTLVLKSEDISDTNEDSNPYSKTGKGNFGFVYGKLMACAVDFFVTRGTKVLFMQFSGYTKDMELVYKRIMDRLNAEYPSMAMRPYEPEQLPDHLNHIYVSLSAIDNIRDVAYRKMALDNTQGLRQANKLKKIKELKRARNPQDLGEIY